MGETISVLAEDQTCEHYQADFLADSTCREVDASSAFAAFPLSRMLWTLHHVENW